MASASRAAAALKWCASEARLSTRDGIIHHDILNNEVSNGGRKHRLGAALIAAYIISCDTGAWHGRRESRWLMRSDIYHAALKQKEWQK